MIEKLKLILEYIWLILALVSLSIFSYEWYVHTIQQAYPFILISVIATLFFIMRRKRRKN